MPSLLLPHTLLFIYIAKLGKTVTPLFTISF